MDIKQKKPALWAVIHLRLRCAHELVEIVKSVYPSLIEAFPDRVDGLISYLGLIG